MSASDKPKEGLKERLETACDDLWWSSESDYPVEVVWQPERAIAPVETAKDDDSLDSITQKVLGWLSFWEEEDVEVVAVADFFEKATAPKRWHTEENKEQLARLRALEALLKSELTHLQVYRCSEVEVTVYVLGYLGDRVLAGIRTIVVET